MRWKPERISRFLADNTDAAKRVFAGKARPRRRDLVRLHRVRGGLRDHLLALWLVIPTFGISALLWKRLFGSCCFAGFIDEATGRVGCLIHPFRVGQPDLRRHAFPLIPTLGCDRELRCPMLDDAAADFTKGSMETSLSGFLSLREGTRCLKQNVR